MNETDSELVEEDMQEKVGKITLDYSRYSGQDFYSDGAVEDELLEVVKHHPEEDFVRIIRERRSWPFLYHLSYLRENILDWVPMEKNAKVLEVGSGCGAVTGVLSRKAGEVTCVELSKKRSLINAWRHRDCDNVTIRVGNFKDIEQDLDTDYDYICLIGVFEYAESYIGGETPYEDFLQILRKHLAPGGRILMAIENRLGLKYFAGCREDHLNTFFSGVENYRKDDGVRTFSRPALERIFADCGIEDWQFYYPYPDYKFMTAVYSDTYLPRKGDLAVNYRNFDRDRMLLFDETLAYNGILEDGLFPVFANSYLAVLGESFPVAFTKYSNDRAPEYRIKTEIAESLGADGSPVIEVRKCPMGAAAENHIRSLETACRKLEERYQGSGLAMNACSLEAWNDSVCAALEYVEGVPLSDLMNECLRRNDREGFYSLFREYVRRSCHGEELPIVDYDMIFQNIYVSGDRWTVLDYEWTFGKAVDGKKLAWRALYYFLKESEYRSRVDEEMLIAELGLTRQECDAFLEEEQGFQDFVAEGHCSLEQMRVLLGNNMWEPGRTLERYPDASNVNRVQVYEDLGGGYSEENSYFAAGAYRSDSDIEMELTVGEQVKMLRIDPSMCPCIVKILELTFNGEPVAWDRRKSFLVNGTLLRPEKGAAYPSIVFSTGDPNINISLEKLEKREKNLLRVRMEMIRIPGQTAKDLEAGAAPYIRIK